jgi:hypothetical protein
MCWKGKKAVVNFGTFIKEDLPISFMEIKYLLKTTHPPLLYAYTYTIDKK